MRSSVEMFSQSNAATRVLKIKSKEEIEHVNM